MMSYLCENGAEGMQSGDAQEDAKCKKKLNKAMDNAYPINPKRTLGLSVTYAVYPYV